jgi:hypothetical protein
VRRRYSFVYPLPNQGHGDSGQTWYFLRRGYVAAATEAPRDPQTAQRCLELLRAVYGEGSSAEKMEIEDWEMILLVSAWFGKRPAELGRTLAAGEARHQCDPFTAGRLDCDDTPERWPAA